MLTLRLLCEDHELAENESRKNNNQNTVKNIKKKYYKHKHWYILGFKGCRIFSLSTCLKAFNVSIFLGFIWFSNWLILSLSFEVAAFNFITSYRKENTPSTIKPLSYFQLLLLIRNFISRKLKKIHMKCALTLRPINICIFNNRVCFFYHVSTQ